MQLATAANRRQEIISCPLCSAPARPKLRLAHTRVYECAAHACRLRFADPQLGGEELAAAYARLYYPSGREVRPVLENTPPVVIDQALRGIGARLGSASGMRLLDYGCGRGEFSRVARGFGFVPVGIEQDAEARRAIEWEAKFPVYPDLESLEQQEEDKRFSLIVLWQVIEHLRRPWEELARLRKLLNQDGWLLAATPNANALKARVQGARWENYWNPTHFYYFTPRSLRGIFERAGFSPVEQWRLKIRYTDRGPLRRAVQNFLKSTHLDGDLFFAGRSGSTNAGCEQGVRAGFAGRQRK